MTFRMQVGSKTENCSSDPGGSFCYLPESGGCFSCLWLSCGCKTFFVLCSSLCKFDDSGCFAGRLTFSFLLCTHGLSQLQHMRSFWPKVCIELKRLRKTGFAVLLVCRWGISEAWKEMHVAGFENFDSFFSIWIPCLHSCWNQSPKSRVHKWFTRTCHKPAHEGIQRSISRIEVLVFELLLVWTAKPCAENQLTCEISG